MEIDYKIISSFLWIIVTCFWYYYYIKEIYKWRNKPHLYTWLVWGTVLFIWFSIQISNNGWYWSLVTLIEALFCLWVVFIAIKRWEKDVTLWDKLSLIAAFISIFFWLVLKQPIISVILIILIDFFWFLPTLRKSYWKPFEESISVYIAWAILFTFAIIWLKEYTFLTYGYPLAIIIFDSILVLMILIRRKKS